MDCMDYIIDDDDELNRQSFDVLPGFGVFNEDLDDLDDLYDLDDLDDD
jgi:hypothetical protein